MSHLRKFGDPVLKQPSVPVEPGTDVSGLIYEMKRVLDEQKGLGLAAQQVGSTHRVALVTLSGKLIVAINLEILERSKATTLSPHEGCLSVRVKGELFRMNVRRNQRVLIRWQDEERETHTRRGRPPRRQVHRRSARRTSDRAPVGEGGRVKNKGPNLDKESA